jgi:hypothetical protein
VLKRFCDTGDFIGPQLLILTDIARIPVGT